MDKFSWPEQPGQSAFPIARPGYFFIGGSAFATAILAIVGLSGPALAGLGITAFICYFFRDPDRICPEADKAVVSPADGKVVKVDIVDETPFFNGRCLKISVFMSVFNVHVNRAPYEGKINKISYFPGKFFSANLDKASEDNEKNAIMMETPEGDHITVVQIAGLVARRIICRVNEGDSIGKGKRFGMICFGSRLDVYLPPDFSPKVSAGHKVSAGTSVLGYLK